MFRHATSGMWDPSTATFPYPAWPPAVGSTVHLTTNLQFRVVYYLFDVLGIMNISLRLDIPAIVE